MEREPPTLADYAITAINPVLIMAMIGSLVFFLVEVLYAGKYSERLLHSLFFFVLGAVLVARIAIQFGGTRAALYGFGLGGAAFLAMNAYVEYPPGTPLRSVAWLVNLGLLLLIGWSSQKLTWDCTHIDENRDSSGRGLLAAAGLDTDHPVAAHAVAPTGALRPIRRKKKSKHDSRLWDWFGRYQRHRAIQQKQGHTPGVWIIYFALAALPLFAIGQSLIALDDSTRRRRSFALMTVYISSALGLLVTTSLLGLRRYLRQRKVRIPVALTTSWFILGSVLIMAFIAIGAFLPRPHSEVPWFGLQRAGTSEREASDYAQRSRDSGTGEGTAGSQTKSNEGQIRGKNEKPGGKDESRHADTTDASSPREHAVDQDDRANGEVKRDSTTGTNAVHASAPQTGMRVALDKVAGFFKWIVIAVVVVLMLIGVVVAVLRYLAPFTHWAKNLLDVLRNWWATLFGAELFANAPGESEVPPHERVRPPLFHTFANPFEDGTARRRDLRELIAYSFEAFDSWAYEQRLGRAITETPLEFTERIGQADHKRQKCFRAFGVLHARATYSEAPLPADTMQQLESFWDELIHSAEFAAERTRLRDHIN